MRLFHISLHDHANQDKLILHADTLGSWSVVNLQNRSKIVKILNFISKTIASKCKIGEKLSIEDGEFVVHVFVNRINLAVIIISDLEYPKEIAHRIIEKILQEDKVDSELLLKFLEYYQNPNVDKIYKLKTELQETKEIICKTLDKVLERGETLDDLVSKTQYLSDNSKSFYKVARKVNSRWCPFWFPFF